jgi:hypothetical protein
VRFDSEEQDVRRACLLEIVNHCRPDDKLFVRRHHSNTVFVHRAEMRTTRKQHNLFTAARHARAEVGAYRSSSRNQEPQLFLRTAADCADYRISIFLIRAIRG